MSEPKLADLIAFRLHVAVTELAAAGFSSPFERGLAYGGPDSPTIVLTVEDVAWIAALAAEEWHGTAGNPTWHGQGLSRVEAAADVEQNELWRAGDRCDPASGTHAVPHRGCILR